ncbi:MAG: hypothetical protein QNJ40_18405 [Xanthomonadales bacterium]|nr:hypothetical protein [Xanthomonadales bacterium]
MNTIVWLNVVSSDESEVTASGILGFTATSPTGLPITIRGIDDLEVDGDQTVTITVSVDPDRTTDPSFLLAQPVSFNVTNLDNDFESVPLSPWVPLVLVVLCALTAAAFIAQR